MKWLVSLYCAGAMLTAVVNARAQPDAIMRGEYLARAGDCVSCHSIREGQPFTGGLEMGTPVGNIYSTNITPDPETGIGSYSLNDFKRAVRGGVAKDRRRLYPAMPYPSFAKITDDDMASLYAFFMHGVKPVRQTNLPNKIRWPYSMRWPLALWSTAFARAQPYEAQSGHDAVWNRGAYLVEGLGHCGACHTPRGTAFQERALASSSPLFLSGATLDGWRAPTLRGDVNVGLARWSETDIVAFLKNGRNEHGVVFGSMINAYNNSTQYLTDGDLTAIARYLKSLPAAGSEGKPWAYDTNTTEALAHGAPKSLGASSYLANCAACHGRDGRGSGVLLPGLAGNPLVLDADASSVVNLILNGANRVIAHDVPDSYRMTPFRLMMNDQQVADVANFIRQSWGNSAPAVSAEDVTKLRDSTNMSSNRAVILKMR